ncbi:hypothetical protein Pmani_019422 [Petrolisthes manimaculis]|uniref:Uncharacterized protein n=1 Tax=Petrolisthes manimaculis TaxID=1843537 RepID=A0AAE1PIG0_9EUCA|nr:hypothetical protein Pmani_019422 [Petrolisthes manimaculis]
MLDARVEVIHPHGHETIEGQPENGVNTDGLEHTHQRPPKVSEVQSVHVGIVNKASDGSDDGDVEDAHQQVTHRQYDEGKSQGNVPSENNNQYSPIDLGVSKGKSQGNVPPENNNQYSPIDLGVSEGGSAEDDQGHQETHGDRPKAGGELSPGTWRPAVAD